MFIRCHVKWSISSDRVRSQTVKFDIYHLGSNALSQSIRPHADAERCRYLVLMVLL
jgi:hypothetical protein